jgi:hypothetical protein
MLHSAVRVAHSRPPYLAPVLLAHAGDWRRPDFGHLHATWTDRKLASLRSSAAMFMATLPSAFCHPQSVDAWCSQAANLRSSTSGSPLRRQPWSSQAVDPRMRPFLSAPQIDLGHFCARVHPGSKRDGGFSFFTHEGSWRGSRRDHWPMLLYSTTRLGKILRRSLHWSGAPGIGASV